jgi:RNA polymerase sigma-70 factor (ECF subfamily)
VQGVVETDEQLMLEVRRGSRTAFETLFARYREAVWRFFRRRTAEAGGAEELAQDTFVAVLEGARRYEGRGSFRSYLFGTAYNVLSSHRRRDAHYPTVTLEADPRDDGADLDAAIWVRDAIATLDPADREVLMLREYEQLSYQEIAELRRIPLNTVRSQLFRARAALKAALEVQAPESARTNHVLR